MGSNPKRGRETKMIMPWGTHKGEELESIPSSYLGWLARDCENEDICKAADEEYRWRSDNNAHIED